MRSVFAQALELHRKHDLPVREVPVRIQTDEILLRAFLMSQEFFELLEEMTGRSFHEEEFDVREVLREWRETGTGQGVGDPGKIGLELADLAMTVAGTALHYGLHLDGLAEEVHASNMSKERSPTGKAEKLVKGTAFEPPNGDRGIVRSKLAWESQRGAETLLDDIERIVREGTERPRSSTDLTEEQERAVREMAAAEQDAAVFGTGFLVDGRRVAPQVVRVFTRAPEDGTISS